MQQTPTPTDLAKATRMARALLDEGYDHNYVANALREKGLTDAQVQHVLRSGTEQVLTQKLKTNRNLLLVVGFLWITGIAAYALTDHTITETSMETGEMVTRTEPGPLALRGFLALGIVTVLVLVRHAVLFVKSANNEMQKK